MAVWYRYNGAAFVIQAALRPAGGRWETPVDLGDEEGGGEQQVVMDPRGNAVAVWRRTGGANFSVQSAIKLASGGWQPPVDLSQAGENAMEPQVAIDSQGNAVAVWQGSDGASKIIQAALRPAGGDWRAPGDLSAAGGDAVAPQVAVDTRGGAVAVWQRSDGARNVVQAALRPVGGEWKAPVNLSAAGQEAFSPQVAVDAHGNAVAVWGRFWGRFYGAKEIVQASSYTRKTGR